MIDLTELYSSTEGCRLCPRRCSVRRPGPEQFLQADSVQEIHLPADAAQETRTGYCKAPAGIMAARAALHHWEEPCISGTKGSGTVFFTGCTLKCRFCQNYKISRNQWGKAISSDRLAEIFLSLQKQGAHNINLVTATHYLPWILPALEQVKECLHIPVVYNCGGYERPETIKALKPYVDIWLPDLKYFDSELSGRLSQAPDYFAFAASAILQMIRQTGAPQFDEEGLMKRGVIIRHLVLPGHRDDSIRLLHWMANTLPRHQFYISLLSQYTPYQKDPDYPELNRRITRYEYEKVVEAALELGLDQGFMQKKSSAREEYTPSFALQGL